MASRQWEWQLKKKALGLCVTCGKRKIKKVDKCAVCYEKQRLYRVKWYQENYELQNERVRKWRSKNPKYNKTYYAAHAKEQK